MRRHGRWLRPLQAWPQDEQIPGRAHHMGLLDIPMIPPWAGGGTELRVRFAVSATAADLALIAPHMRSRPRSGDATGAGTSAPGSAHVTARSGPVGLALG